MVVSPIIMHLCPLLSDHSLGSLPSPISEGVSHISLQQYLKFQELLIYLRLGWIPFVKEIDYFILPRQMISCCLIQVL